MPKKNTPKSGSRLAQPKCHNCNHAASFHPQYDRCYVVGCSCEAWAAEDAQVASQA